MDSKILYLNTFVVFILSLIIVATLMTKKENLKARLSFCFFFLNIILVVVSNLVTYYYGNYNLIFMQIVIIGLAFLYGPMLLQYVFFTLEIRLPKYWVINYWFVLLLFLSSLYYVFLPEEIQKQYLKEMILGNHTPVVIAGNLVLLHSIIYFIYLRVFLKRFEVKTDEIHLQIKKEWVSSFVNYMIFGNVILIVYYIITSLFYSQYLVFGDLVIVPIIVLVIYSFIVVKHSQKHKEAEFKYVLSEIENQNKLLQQRLAISRDLHDNIGSQLTFIISSIDSVNYTLDKREKKLINKLSNISDFTKETIVELRDTVWALNSVEMKFENLEIRINNFIDKAKALNQDIEFSILIDENLKREKLSSIEGMNIYRTIQEGIHNSFKHAKANSIKINVEKVNNIKKISILDDGVGFNPITVKKGNGLKNMKNRIEQIGGVFNIISNDKGTEVEILI